MNEQLIMEAKCMRRAFSKKKKEKKRLRATIGGYNQDEVFNFEYVLSKQIHE